MDCIINNRLCYCLIITIEVVNHKLQWQHQTSNFITLKIEGKKNQDNIYVQLQDWLASDFR